MKLLFLIALSTSLATAGSPPATIPPTSESEPPSPVTFEITHTESGEPQIIRILYLDDGAREIVLPPARQAPVKVAQKPNGVASGITHVEASQFQVIRIFNSDEGNREIVLPPAP